MTKTDTQLARARQQITDLITDADIGGALTVLRDGLRAESTVRTHAGGPTGTSYQRVPDNHIRHVSARLLLEYAFGKPSISQEITVTHEQRAIAPDEIAKRILASGVDVSGVVSTYVDSLRNAKADTPQDE